jgi:hypothetical protein
MVAIDGCTMQKMVYGDELYGDLRIWDYNYYTSKICLTRCVFRWEVVAAIKQPMEADVSGGTAEAVLRRDPAIFCWRCFRACRSCRSDDAFCLFIDDMNYKYKKKTLDPLRREDV